MICPHITNSLHIENDGYIYPCFNTANKLTNTIIQHEGNKVHASSLDPTTILQWDSLQKMRDDLSNNKWPIACSKCRLLEEKGLDSTRLNVVPNSDTVKLEIIHLRLGNKCNLRCVMCGPNASNQWYDDYVSITETTTFKVANNLYHLTKGKSSYQLENDNFNFSENEKLADVILANSNNLKEIHFHGGEPLLSKTHRKLIDLLIQKQLSKNISLIYHTNATINDTIIFNQLTFFKSVRFILSLDGIAEINDAIRWPSKWGQIVSVIDKIKHFDLSVNHTLHALNAEHLTSFLDGMNDYKLVTNVSYVTEPGYISISGLLDEKQIARLINNNLKYSEHIIKAATMPTNIDQMTINRNRFKRLWNNFEKTQNQNWKKVFPIAFQSMNEWHS